VRLQLKKKNEKEEIFIIDKWCVLGSLKDNSESLEDMKSDYSFDVDTYKILSRYLTNNKNLQISLSLF